MEGVIWGLFYSSRRGPANDHNQDNCLMINKITLSTVSCLPWLFDNNKIVYDELLQISTICFKIKLIIALYEKVKIHNFFDEKLILIVS